MLFVAALAIASAACAREEVLDGGQARGEFRTFTCSFDEEAQTKTDITKQGKTVWSEGDKIFVTNGTESDTLAVDAKFAGQRYFEFSTTLEGEIYVVYPCTAAKEVKDGKFTLEVPSEQNGQFGSANISCAVAKDRYVKMRNVTSVIRFNVDPDAKAAVKVVAINSNGNNVAGTFSVDMTSGSPVVSTIEGNNYSAGVTVNVNGDHGNSLYATVIPGTYNAGLTMTAVTVDLHNASESKATVSEKEFKVNAYYDLGTIGADLKPLAGDGTKGNPWQISTAADFLAFAYYVNEGNNMKGEYVKLMDNIKTVTTSVGYYDASVDAAVDPDNVKKQFVGDFDGNGKTVTLNINQTAKRSCGLFGAIAEGANIHDVTVEGTVNSTFDDAAGVCGLVNAAAGAKITNCVNKANVKSTGNYIGGIAGWSDSGNANELVFDNCTNEGSIAGKTMVGGVCGTLRSGTVINSKNSGDVIGNCSTGGIVGYGLGGTVKGSSNSGSVTATETNGDVYYIKGTKGSFGANYNNGTGGICGWAQNITISDCKNSGTMKAQNKVGGISGSCYWSNISDCENTGRIVATHWGVAGGILGWGMTVANIRDCVNNGEVVGEKLEKTQGRWVGGIAGYIQVQLRDKTSYSVERCTNNGAVTGNGKGVGGVVGYSYSYNNSYTRIELRDCANTGKVTNTQDATGGIVGYQYDWGSWTQIPLDNCKNTGDVTGLYDVGGIIGYFEGRTTGSSTILRNCENSGNILSTKKETDTGAYAGGIIGRTNNTPTRFGTRIWNCLNTGKVQYSDASFKNAYVGGIGGSVLAQIWNSYNGGEVGLAGAETPEYALGTIGALAGNVLVCPVEYSYYLVGTSVNALGTSSSIKAQPNVISAQKDGTLSVSTSINGKDCIDVVDALNASLIPASQAFYYKWTTGPKFSLTGNVGIGDGLDLGNGGKL